MVLVSRVTADVNRRVLAEKGDMLGEPNFAFSWGPSLTMAEGQEWLESLASPVHCTNAAKVPRKLPRFLREASDSSTP